MERQIADQRLEVLMVEDNAADVRIASEAWREAGVRHLLRVARNGEEALSVLRRQAPHDAARRPDLVILDLNLPRMDGRELLAELKSDAELRHIPVIVLTTSDRDRDIQRSYDLQANCYIVKPIGLESAFRVMRAIAEFWFEIVTLPPGKRSPV